MALMGVVPAKRIIKIRGPGQVQTARILGHLTRDMPRIQPFQVYPHRQLHLHIKILCIEGNLESNFGRLLLIRQSLSAVVPTVSPEFLRGASP